MPTSKRVQPIIVSPSTLMTDILKVHANAANHELPAGFALVVDDSGKLIGTITDGDIRRALLKSGGSVDLVAREIMTDNPIAFLHGTPFREILATLPLELEKRNRRARRFLGKIVLVDAENHPTGVLEYHQLWEQRVATHRHVVIVGLGYVGLTLALVLAERGFRVTGVDVNSTVTKLLSEGKSHIHEIGLNELLREQLNRNFYVLQEIPADGDVFVIAVGTPVPKPTGNNTLPMPRMDYLLDAAEAVGKRLSPGALVVLRSTVPPSSTRNFVLPVLEAASGFKAGTDFHLAFAPERTVEGNAIQELYMLPQVIGGINEDSVEATVALFRDVTSNIIRVESLEAAEMVKLINNCYRDLVFSFANEMAQLGSVFNLDITEVIRAANQGYPRNTVPLPSPGVGGPCLTKDPYILVSVAEKYGLSRTLSQHGRDVNESMHKFVVNAVIEQLRRLGKDPAQCTLLVCGLAFKGEPETTDLRGSTSLEIAHLLKEQVGKLYSHDPIVPPDMIRAEGLEPLDLPDGFTNQDAVLILNNHRFYSKLDVFDMTRRLNAPGIVYDAWHILRADEVLNNGPIVYMGLGYMRSNVAQILPKENVVSG